LGLADNEDWIAWLAKNNIPAKSRTTRECARKANFGKGLNRKRDREKSADNEQTNTPKVLFFYSTCLFFAILCLTNFTEV